MPTMVSSGTGSVRRSRTKNDRRGRAAFAKRMRAAWNSIGLEAMEIAMNVRRKWKSLTWFVAIVCGMAMTPALHAAVVYEYVSDQPSYTVSPGTFVNVLVYLRETLTAGSQSLITSDGGLFGAGMPLLRTAPGLPHSPPHSAPDAP